jgi:hypothetical protein
VKGFEFSGITDSNDQITGSEEKRGLNAEGAEKSGEQRRNTG